MVRHNSFSQCHSQRMNVSYLKTVNDQREMIHLDEAISSDEEQEVLGLDGLSEDEAYYDKLKSNLKLTEPTASGEESEEEEEAQGGWGRKKTNYYDADSGDEQDDCRLNSTSTRRTRSP